MPGYRNRSNIQLCYPFSEKRLYNQGRLKSRWSLPAILEPKLNGERGRFLVHKGRCLLFSSTDELITTLPHLNQQFLNYPDGQYDTELYKHGWSLNKIHSAISTVKTIHPDVKHIEAHVFDIIEENKPLHERILNLATIREFLPNTTHIIPVKKILVHSLDEIMHYYDLWIKEGYEGFVLKEINSTYIQKDPAYRSPYWLKFKPKQTDTYTILSFNEAISKDGTPLGMVGSFTCIDDEGNKFDVGAGKLSHKNRIYIWAEGLLEGSKLKIEYQTLSDVKGVPHFSRAVEIIYPEHKNMENSYEENDL